MKILDLFRTRHAGMNLTKRPYIIAEAGVNHEGRMDIAKRLIDEAKTGGADAIKFQTYRARTLASKNSPAYWDTSLEPATNQYDLFNKYDGLWKSEFEELKRYCNSLEIEFMSTPFDLESADFLNNMMDTFKISSSDITNKPFIEYLSKFGKPILLSTGASSLDEIKAAVSWIDAAGNPVALLHCILNYPTVDENANLGMIRSLQNTFPDRVIGYSDHTLPKDMKTLEVATLLGAAIIEKHFTYNKTLPGNDHYHAMDKNDLKLFRKNSTRIFQLLGSFEKNPLPSEYGARKNARRSLVAAHTIPAGKVIEQSDLTWKRPGSGISPSRIDDVIGKMALKKIAEDEIVQPEMFA